MNISLDKIDLPTHDLRASIDEDALDELAASMRDHGQLQAIELRSTEGERFEVIFGARRTRAARLLHWAEIRAEIIEETITSNAHSRKLIENVQRLDMTPIEEGYGLLNLIGDGQADIRELQRQTGKSREWIRTRLDLVNLPDDLQGAVQAGMIGIGVARAFGEIENTDVRQQYLRAAVENGCTADMAKVWTQQAKFAEGGIAIADQFNLDMLNDPKMAAPVDQHYPCFICVVSTNWRRVNVLPICSSCQDAVTSTRPIPNRDTMNIPLAPDNNV